MLVVSKQVEPGNKILLNLPQPELNRISQHLEQVRFEQGKSLYAAGDAVRYAYFPIRGLLSLVSTAESGYSVELAMVGNEGMVGVSVISKMPFEVVSRIQTDVLRSQVYVYQFKINAKKAFGGDNWEWHQDYIFWRKEDGMPSARVTSIVIYLDDVTEFNGPLFLIPGSHKEGVIDVSPRDEDPAQDIRRHETYRESPNWIANLTTKLRYSLDRVIVGEMIEKHGIVSPKGPCGSVLLMDGNTIHGSPSNISPFDRAVVIVTFNSVENIPPPVSNPRPEFLSNRQASPIEPLAVDSLLV